MMNEVKTNKNEAKPFSALLEARLGGVDVSAAETILEAL